MTRTSIRAAARNASLLARKFQPVTVHQRKMYVDCRHGQLHVHTGFPSSGGFDELTPMVCVHPAGQSGRIFRGLLADLGRDRSVYAPDLPGHGESDPPASPPSMGEYAAAIGDLVDSLRLRQVDVLGYQAGSLAAIELAISRPEQVRRVVLAGVPVFDAREREAFGNRSLALRASDAAGWCASAAVSYPAGERLPLLRQPALVLRPRDEFWDMCARADGLIRECRRLDLPDKDGGLFEADASAVARLARDFLDH